MERNVRTDQRGCGNRKEKVYQFLSCGGMEK